MGLHLLIFLHQGTTGAAAGDQTVIAAITLNTVFAADLTARGHLKQGLEGAAQGEAAPSHALQFGSRLVGLVRGWMFLGGS